MVLMYTMPNIEHRANKKLETARTPATLAATDAGTRWTQLRPLVDTRTCISMTVDNQRKLFICATVEDSNFKFGIQLGLGEQLAEK